MRPATAGTVRVGGRSVRNGDPRAAIGAGVAYVPEDRLGTGVAPGLSIASNVVLKAYRKPPVSLGPMLRMRRIRELRRACHRDVTTCARRARAFRRGNCRAATCRRSCSRGSSPGSRSRSSRRRRLAGLDVAGIETVHSYLRDAAATGSGGSADQRGPRRDPHARRPDRGHVRGWIAGERDARVATVEELGLLMAGGGELMRIERRLRQPWWLTVVVPVASIAVAFVSLGVRSPADRPSAAAVLPSPVRRRVHRERAR